jgi:hypothetical protein
MSNLILLLNGTYSDIDPSKCTVELCSMTDAMVNYFPSLPGNAFYLAYFAVFLFVHLFLGYRYRTWGYLAGLSGGLVLEVIGYLGRIMMHNNPWTMGPFLM